MLITDLETPVAIVDLDKLEANIIRLQVYLNKYGVANRPHIKTHKIPEIAHKQISAGAIGITCQKLTEAEVMAKAGIRDIFLPYNILGAVKLDRLMNLVKLIHLSVTADSEIVVRGLSMAAHNNNCILEVLVECDTGEGRCGVQSPQAASDLACIIANSPGLLFGGLMTYCTSANTAPFIREAKRVIESHGIHVIRVTGGGTPSASNPENLRDVTEHRAGVYVYGDRHSVRSGAMTLSDCSFSVLSTVVSRPTLSRGILDAGSKTLSSDLLGFDGYGMILEYPKAQIYDLSEEHGNVDFSLCDTRPEVGERITILPNHACPVSNLLNEVVGFRNRVIEVFYPVACRGGVQ